MNESFIFNDNGKDSIKAYNANNSINIKFKNKNDDCIKFQNDNDGYVNIYNDNCLDNIPQTKCYDNNLNYCSQYFNVNYSEVKHPIKFIYIITQFFIVSTIYHFFWTNINLINILTTDSIISSLIFILYFYCNNNSIFINNTIYQPSYFIRYIYYFILLSIYYIVDFITWGYLSILLNLILPFFILPVVIENIVYNYNFKKITNAVINDCENFIYFIISKHMSKILSIISNNCLDYNPTFKEDEFKPFIKKVSVDIFINFICSFLFASILHYFEKNGTTVFTAIFRQFYFRQYYFKKENIDKNNKNYLINIMKTKNWIKLLDPYTLNRILKMYLLINNNKENSIIKHIKNIINQFNTSFSKIMICWTISSLCNIKYISILSYLLFIKSKHKINIYLKIIVIFLFTIISFFSNEVLLLIIMCEFFTRLLVNKITRDIFYDIYKHLKHIILQNTTFYIQNNTILLSCYLALSTMSYNSHNVMTILFIIIIPIGIIKIFWSSPNLNQTYIGLIGTLLFGYLSNYNIYHCLVLPYIFQIINSKENLLLLVKKKKIL